MSFSLSEILHNIGQAVLWPCMFILLLLMIVAVWQIGDMLVEYFVERRKRDVNVPELIQSIHNTPNSGLTELIESTSMGKRHKAMLIRLCQASYLPKASLEAMAERLLATEEAYCDRSVAVTNLVTKLGPMFGLLGTLIPLGPGIIGLSQGDTATLAESLGIAFDTTIAGMLSAAVACIISSIRKRWYSDDIVSLEALTEALLEEVAPNA